MAAIAQPSYPAVLRGINALPRTARVGKRYVDLAYHKHGFIPDGIGQVVGGVREIRMIRDVLHSGEAT